MAPDATIRERLPQRRRCESLELVVEGQTYSATIGFYDDGRPGEIFIGGGKVGSQVNAMLSDGAILASRCLQGGIPAGDLARSMSRVPTSLFRPATESASPLGAALDVAAEMENDALSSTETGKAADGPVNYPDGYIV